MRLCLFLLLLLLIIPASKSQDRDERAYKVLESLEKKITTAKDARWDFTLTISYPDDAPEEFSGRYFQRENRFRLEMPDHLIVCDGTTQWNVDKAVKEITIYDFENPDQYDLTNPSNLLKIYDHPDFEYFLESDGTQNGRAFQRIEFKPLKSDQDIFKVRLDVWNGSGDLRSVEVYYKNGIKYFLNIDKTHLNSGLQSTLFNVNPASHPEFHVEDLRF